MSLIKKGNNDSLVGSKPKDMQHSRKSSSKIFNDKENEQSSSPIN